MQVLRAVVTSGSVTAAAERLGYTPSAVSQQVAALEAQAGTPCWNGPAGACGRPRPGPCWPSTPR